MHPPNTTIRFLSMSSPSPPSRGSKSCKYREAVDRVDARQPEPGLRADEDEGDWRETEHDAECPIGRSFIVSHGGTSPSGIAVQSTRPCFLQARASKTPCRQRRSCAPAQKSLERWGRRTVGRFVPYVRVRANGRSEVCAPSPSPLPLPRTLPLSPNPLTAPASAHAPALPFRPPQPIT